MRGHTMGRRLGRVVAVVALGIAVSLTAGPAVSAAAQAQVTVGDEVPVRSVADQGDTLGSITTPVLLFDYGWH